MKALAFAALVATPPLANVVVPSHNLKKNVAAPAVSITVALAVTRNLVPKSVPIIDPVVGPSKNDPVLLRATSPLSDAVKL
jgi:hypothetical protein